jgi:hypothetical protein
MAITNLTKTKWLLPQVPDTLSGLGIFYLDFSISSDGAQFSDITSVWGNYLSLGLGYSYYDNSWHSSEGYGVIGFYDGISKNSDVIYDDSNTTDISLTITGGIDVENTALISWLETNCTQLDWIEPVVTVSSKNLTIASLNSNEQVVL